MATSEELLKFIKQQRENGLPDKAIREALLQEGGWNQEDLDQAFKAVAEDGEQPSDEPSADRSTESPKTSPSPQVTPTVDRPEPDSMSDPTHQETSDGKSATTQDKKVPPQPAKQSSSWKRAIVMALIGLFVATGAFAGYYAVTNWERWTMSNEEIISQALSNFADVSSYSFEGDVKMDIAEGSNNAEITLDMTGSGTTLNSEEGPKAWTDVEFGFSTKQGSIEANVTTLAKVRIVDETVYLYVDEVPTEFGPIPFPEKQWILIDLSDMSQITQAAQKVTRSNIDPVDQEMYRELITGAFDVAKQTQLFTIDRTDSFFDDTYVFEVNIHPTRFKEFSEQFAQQMSQNENLIRETREAIQILNKNFQETEDSVFAEAEQSMQEHFSIELMVSKGDLYLTNFNFSFDDAPDEMVGEEFEILFDFGVNFSDFNEPVNVEVPENARPIEEILPRSSRSTSNPFLNQAGDEGRKASVKSSMASIRAEAEILIDDDHTYPDDMFTNESYGMTTTLQHIKNNTSYPLVYGISPNGQHYAVSIQLDEEEYFCVDSEGVAMASNTQLIDPENGDLSCAE